MAKEQQLNNLKGKDINTTKDGKESITTFTSKSYNTSISASEGTGPDANEKNKNTGLLKCWAGLILMLAFIVILVIPLTVAFAFKHEPDALNEPFLQTKASIQIRILPGPKIRLLNGNDKTVIKSNIKVAEINVITNTETIDNTFVSTLNVDNPMYRPQSENGIKRNGDEFISFWTNLTDTEVENTSFRIEMNVSHPVIIHAFGYLRPLKINETNKIFEVPLLNSNSEVIGLIEVDYLIIRPITRFHVPVVDDYISIAGKQYTGHRGTGIGIRYDLPQHFIENTISAFNYVCSKGAQMVELDIQLSKDLKPIVFHDFEVKTYLFDRNDVTNITFTVPTKDLTYNVMQQVSFNLMPHVPENVEKDGQPFEEFKDVLLKLDPKCGIDVEIKYPVIKLDLTPETEIGLNLNEYVDRILEIMFAYGGNRTMFITSFHPDLCSMIRLKQNKYHVGFLITGTEPWSIDPRTDDLQNGVSFSKSMHFKGIVPEVDVVLDDTTIYNTHNINLVKKNDLDLFLWGAKLNNSKIIHTLLENGVDMVIFDHIDKILQNSTWVS